MSLDIWLHDTKEIEIECSECGHKRMVKPKVFELNITHNLNTMAKEAGIYYAMWRPEEIEATKAKHLIFILKYGISKLKNNPEHFKKFNPENGWGKYEYLLEAAELYLKACYKYPEAIIDIWR